jgi:hypothetical protein
MRDGIVPQMVDEIVQGVGLREGSNLIMAIQSHADIPPAVRGSIFGGFAMRQIELARLRGEPASVLDWADTYIGPAYVGPKALTSIVNFAASADAPATFDWIEARTGRWTPEQEAAVWPAIAQAMLASAPEQLNEWMNANPDHPQRDNMAKAVAQQLAQRGKFDEATAWQRMIGDAAANAEIGKVIEYQRTRPRGDVPQRAP